jgi:hypothetical protein
MYLNCGGETTSPWYGSPGCALYLQNGLRRHSHTPDARNVRSARKKGRELITFPARSLGGVLIYIPAGKPIWLDAREGSLRVPLRFFAAAQARAVAAARERVFPGDNSGPGATETGLVTHIDRRLDGCYRRDKYRYADKSTAQQVYHEGIPQLCDLPRCRRSSGTRSLTPSKAGYLSMLRRHAIEGVLRSDASRQGWEDKTGLSRAKTLHLPVPAPGWTVSSHAQLAQPGQAGLRTGHIHLKVADVEARKTFRVEQFGAGTLHVRDSPALIPRPGIALAFLTDPGGVCIELTECLDTTDAGAPGTPSRVLSRDGCRFSRQIMIGSYSVRQ